MDNIIESKIDADILNDVKKFLLMYFKIAGVALVVLFFVIFVKSFIMSVMLEGILLYAIWITALWLIYKYFRKNKSMAVLLILTILTFPLGFVFLACYEKVKEPENEKETIAFNEVRDFILLYFMLTGTLIVLGHFMAVNNVPTWYVPNLFVSIILYVIWVIMLWFIYKDFRKNRRMLNYFSLIVLTLPYGLIMVSCRTKLKEVDKNNKKKYISEYIS
ncbi:MAG: hypothetical protein A2452_11255 [Candidatus Firestonebacteria bacterium RIFOXYC2_FULL_39_67]|nr:MAG: hypothetical protein A2452_11255 [Candidatus Firestonebacteria bacterium RIFOXYC2_FULL_39_67]